MTLRERLRAIVAGASEKTEPISNSPLLKPVKSQSSGLFAVIDSAEKEIVPENFGSSVDSEKSRTGADSVLQKIVESDSSGLFAVIGSAELEIHPENFGWPSGAASRYAAAWDCIRTDPNLRAAVNDILEERIAIMTFDGGLTAAEAEAAVRDPLVLGRAIRDAMGLSD